MTALRRGPFDYEGSGWYADHAPSRQVSGRFASLNIDSRYTGVGVGIRRSRDLAGYGYRMRLLGSVGRVDGNQLESASRALVHGELGLRLSIPVGAGSLSPSVIASETRGSTSGETWTRRVVRGRIDARGPRRGLTLESTFGTVTEAETGDFGRAFEQFAVGGAAVPFVDQAFYSQRLPLPSVPVGYAAGREVEIHRVSLRAFWLNPWAAWVAGGDSVTRYQRLFGVEHDWDIPTLGIATLPNVRIRAGIGYSLDQPYDEKLRPYVSVTYRP
jgi:hypothetical protein